MLARFQGRARCARLTAPRRCSKTRKPTAATAGCVARRARAAPLRASGARIGPSWAACAVADATLQRLRLARFFGLAALAPLASAGRRPQLRPDAPQPRCARRRRSCAPSRAARLSTRRRFTRRARCYPPMS